MSKKKAKSLGYTSRQKQNCAAAAAVTGNDEVKTEPNEQKAAANTATAEQKATGTPAENAQSIASGNTNAAENAIAAEAGLPESAKQEAEARISELYKSELNRLYVFAARWQAALPIEDRSPESAQRKATVAAIREIISDNKTINTAEQGREIVARITDLLSAGGQKTPSDSFDLNEVLNPGELDLESLCKELGVMD